MPAQDALKERNRLVAGRDLAQTEQAVQARLLERRLAGRGNGGVAKQLAARVQRIFLIHSMHCL